MDSALVAALVGGGFALLTTTMGILWRQHIQQWHEAGKTMNVHESRLARMEQRQDNYIAQFDRLAQQLEAVEQRMAEKLDGLAQDISGMRVDLAGDYVTRAEWKESQRERR